MLNEETGGAGELIGLFRRYLNGQNLVREIGSGELIRLGQIGFVLVYLAGRLVLLPRGKAAGFQTLFLLFVFGLAGCVVVRGQCGGPLGRARMVAPGRCKRTPAAGRTGVVSDAQLSVRVPQARIDARVLASARAAVPLSCPSMLWTALTDAAGEHTAQPVT
jgi:hypothetical protein